MRLKLLGSATVAVGLIAITALPASAGNADKVTITLGETSGMAGSVIHLKGTCTYQGAACQPAQVDIRWDGAKVGTVPANGGTSKTEYADNYTVPTGATKGSHTLRAENGTAFADATFTVQ